MAPRDRARPPRGDLVAQRLGEAVAAGLVDLPVELTVTSYATTGGILVIVAIAVLLSLRRVARLDLASATKTFG